MLICSLRGCAPTWQGLGPLDGGDDLASPKSVQGGHEACGGVRDGAVVASVDNLRLDGLQQGQHGGNELRHGLQHQRGLRLAGQEGRGLGCGLLHL